VTAGRLLAGLRYRIAGFGIELIPLRQRSDLAALARRFARRQDAELDIDPGAMELLSRHDWPGNLHEPRSVITRAALSCDGGRLTAQDLRPFLPDSPAGEAQDLVCAQCAGVPWKESQCRSIRTAVRQTGGIAKAARRLGISRTTIYKHLMPT